MHAAHLFQQRLFRVGLIRIPPSTRRYYICSLAPGSSTCYYMSSSTSWYQMLLHALYHLLLPHVIICPLAPQHLLLPHVIICPVAPGSSRCYYMSYSTSQYHMLLHALQHPSTCYYHMLLHALQYLLLPHASICPLAPVTTTCYYMPSSTLAPVNTTCYYMPSTTCQYHMLLMPSITCQYHMLVYALYHLLVPHVITCPLAHVSTTCYATSHVL